MEFPGGLVKTDCQAPPSVSDSLALGQCPQICISVNFLGDAVAVDHRVTNHPSLPETEEFCRTWDLQCLNWDSSGQTRVVGPLTGPGPEFKNH